MRVLLFEDQRTSQLEPITTSRPAYAVSCASYTLLDFVRRLSDSVYGEIRPHLLRIQESDLGVKGVEDWSWPTDEGILAVNARLVPSHANFEVLKGIAESLSTRESFVSKSIDDIAFVAVNPKDLSAIATAQGPSVLGQLIDGGICSERSCDLEMFQWPHDVIQKHMELMNDSMQLRIVEGEFRQLQDGVFVQEGVQIGDHPVIDTSGGPIVLDHNVSVGPFCYLSGPVYAGPGTRVIEHAALKDAVALGHTVKIGGEVEASVIEPFTNKQHHGFLGHSYLGSWINLGAGTCNSDLKNTYGKINIEYSGQKVPSGMQFLGCIVGDYSKTAINTGIFTGKVIGVCSMLYGFVTENVPSFVNYAQIFGQVAEIPPDVMIATQARMFSRRKVTQRDCDIELIRSMYELTSGERDGANQIAGF